MIAISVIAGYTKAETERIWLFLVPFACLAAARSLSAALAAAGPDRRSPPRRS